MHLGNGALTPECAVLAMGTGGVGLAAAAVQLGRERPSPRQLGLAAALGAFVFGVQMLNVQVSPSVSAHLVGGVLLAWMVGPSLAVWTMAMILAVQAIVLGDGGLASLGANIVNMAILPAGAVVLLRRLDCRRKPIAALAAAGAVVLASVLIPLETAIFRPAIELAGWGDFASRMVLSHLAAGAAEGVITLILLLALSPAKESEGFSKLGWKGIACRSAACVALAAALLACQSDLPDGYESAAQNSGLARLLK